jgi:hypothetical protein
MGPSGAAGKVSGMNLLRALAGLSVGVVLLLAGCTSTPPHSPTDAADEPVPSKPVPGRSVPCRSRRPGD